MLLQSRTPPVDVKYPGWGTPGNSIPDSSPEWAKYIPVFRPKRRKNPTRWDGTYLYSLCKGVPPPPGGVGTVV